MRIPNRDEQLLAISLAKDEEDLSYILRKLKEKYEEASRKKFG